MTVPGTSESREASRVRATGRFGDQMHADPGVVQVAVQGQAQPGQKAFSVAMHQSAVITDLSGVLGPESRGVLEADVDVLAALTAPGSPDARLEARGLILSAVEGPAWSIGSELRHAVGSVSRQVGDRTGEQMSETTLWLTGIAVARNADEQYRRTVAANVWRFTNPGCPTSKRRRHAAAVDWALQNASGSEQALQLVAVRLAPRRSARV